MKVSRPLVILLSLFTAASTYACDLCGCYTPTLEVAHEKSWGLYGGAAEQFTHFGTERLDGAKQPNPGKGWLGRKQHCAEKMQR